MTEVLATMPSTNTNSSNSQHSDSSATTAVVLRLRYPDRVPVIVERGCESLPQIDTTKYLFPEQLTVGHLAFVIRKKLALQPSTALFLTCAGRIPPSGALLGDLYTTSACDDGYLRVSYAVETTFG